MERDDARKIPASLEELLEDYRDFLKEGGLRERMTRARIKSRKKR